MFTKLIRGGDATDHIAAERPAELRDIGLENLRGRERWAAGPELLDQAVTRNRLVRPKKQDREQRPRLSRIQRDNAAPGNHLERTEDPELDATIVHVPG